MNKVGHNGGEKAFEALLFSPIYIIIGGVLWHKTTKMTQKVTKFRIKMTECHTPKLSQEIKILLARTLLIVWCALIKTIQLNTRSI